MLQPITKENFRVLITKYSTAELEDLVGKFPYVREAHILLAKKYQLENNPRFDQQLQLAALYANDRQLLYDLFADKTNEEPLFDGVTVEIPVETKEPVVISETEAEVAETAPPTEEITEVETIEVSPVVEESSEVEPETVGQEEASTTSPTLYSFDEWIKALGTITKAPAEQKTVNPELIAQQEAELNKTIMESVPVMHLYERVDEETHYSKGLDQFIEEQINRRKKAEPVKQAAQDELDPEMITETMARIYEMQKKYQKAIRAYEILTLKFPEKNDFFAARINYLKNII